MPWDRKRLLDYVETIQLILGVTDNSFLIVYMLLTHIVDYYVCKVYFVSFAY